MISIKSIFTTLFNNIIELQNTKADISAVQKMHNVDTLEYVLVTKNSAYSSIEVTGVGFVNNMLRVGYTATRSSATGTGDISNEAIFRIKIYTKDLFTEVQIANTINYSTGHLHTLSAGNKSYGSDSKGAYVLFDVQMNATHAGVTGTNGVLIMPANLNPAKYWG